MRLLFDENQGKGVPEALRGVGLKEVSYIRRLYRSELQRDPQRGIKDEEWIPLAGKDGWLVFSGDKAILEAEAQRQLWIEHHVGGVFLSHNSGTAVDVLKLVLRKWDWLETIDRNQARPFAYRLNLSGRARLDSRILRTESA